MEMIAHRGSHDIYPENSLDAFQRSLDLGFDAVELDVHKSGDGICVVHHDEWFPEENEHVRINESTYSRLISARSYVPRLDDVLDLLAHRAHVYIEIKGIGIEQSVVDIINRSKAECSVHAFDHRIAKKVKTLLPRIRVGVLQSSRLIDSVHALTLAGADDLWQWHEFVDADLVAEVEKSGGRVICWTANDPSRWHEFREMGVAGLCTDLSPMSRR